MQKEKLLRYTRKTLKVVLPLLLGLLMVWSLTRKVDWPIVLAELDKGISWIWVLISILFALLSHIIRGLRWRLQLRTLHINPSAHDMAVSVLAIMASIWPCPEWARCGGAAT